MLDAFNKYESFVCSDLPTFARTVDPKVVNEILMDNDVLLDHVSLAEKEPGSISGVSQCHSELPHKAFMKKLLNEDRKDIGYYDEIIRCLPNNSIGDNFVDPLLL